MPLAHDRGHDGLHAGRPAAPAPAKPRRSLRWYHLYFLLVSFDLVTILCTLALSHRVAGIYSRSIDDNRAWAEQMGHISALRGLAASINAPGNHVFASRDVDGEQQRFELALARFHDRLAQEEQMLQAMLGEPDARSFAPYFEGIRALVATMAIEARQLFANLRADRTGLAGRHMSAMDDAFYQLDTVIASFEQRARTYQFEAFQEQHARAASLYRYEVAITALIISIIAAAALYGHRLSRSMAAAELRSIKQITALKRSGEALRRAKAEADAATRAKSMFLAVMSHEIRTPMNGVIGMTNLLEDTALAPRQKDYVETIRRTGDALLSIVNDILDFSKAEAGKIELEIMPFDIHEAVEDVVEMLAPRAFEKGLELSCLVDNDVPGTVAGDPGRLRQILTNLVGNAIKFTDAGHVSVSASLADRGGERLEVRFEVEDTGIGIPPHVRDRLFQSYTQADASTQHRHGGTGLGLAISKNLVELMDGAIGIRDRAEGGTIFWFTVHLGAAPARQQQPGDQDRAETRILCVTRRRTIRAVLTHYLAHEHVHADMVDGAPAAMEHLESAHHGDLPYHAAIIDCDHQDGVELVRRIRLDARDARLPLLSLTTTGNTTAEEAAREAGAFAALTSPLRRARLRQCLWLLQHAAGGNPAQVDQAQPLLDSKPTFDALVLVVDDSPINQKIARHQLQRLGCRVDMADNGQEAIDAARRTPYDLVLMDCIMPEVDGYAATAAIRAHEAGSQRHTPIVAMTAGATADDRDRCMAAGMDDYVSKPMRKEQLADVLRRRLPAREAGDRTGAHAGQRPGRS